ncbi:MAG: glutamate synthase [Deltaproteobacteria bacterium]|nr:glutamate synthase [Deltaproteobacteria bacterium]
MCRLISITSENPISPMILLHSLDMMKEGHDGSGVGLYLTDLGGEFEPYKEFPILSGIFSNAGMKKLDDYMLARGYRPKFERAIRPSKPVPAGTPKRDVYLISCYEYPDDWKYLPKAEIRLRLMLTRVQLRQLGIEDGSMMVFSFWPDVIMLKEVGDPLAIADYLDLADKNIYARSMLAQGRQNTNYAITLYACHPFFVQGVATMTNGENTAFVPIREFLMSRNFPGYVGYQSDSEVFTHILHYTHYTLGMGLEAYKHIITPLKDEELSRHPDGARLRLLKHTCRPLIIDGPNCVIGFTPDRSMFLVQDSKKLRPGIIGGKPGIYCCSSELCGLDAAIPDRDRDKDFQPMKYDLAFVDSRRREIKIWNQWESFTHPH